MQKLGCDDVDSLVPLTPSLDPGFLERAEFREFYKFVFQATCALPFSRAARISFFFNRQTQFNREGTHRTIEKDVVAALLPLAIKDRSQHLQQFVAFLEQASANRSTPFSSSVCEVSFSASAYACGEQCSTTRITLDQWSSFADFSEKVGPPESGFEGYEEDGAWPLLLDEYVEYSKAQKK